MRYNFYILVDEDKETSVIGVLKMRIDKDLLRLSRPDEEPPLLVSFDTSRTEEAVLRLVEAIPGVTEVFPYTEGTKNQPNGILEAAALHRDSG
ncbi:MAG TPA: hypothetical protein VHE53_02590 [Patescibacteria group bacterium]|nr:hypothetical protein [Patescibacteria group bacterium]